MGIHKEKLQSFELALRDAGIEKFNLVSVSSILPPSCKVVPSEEGLKSLKPGQVTFLVLARNDTNEPNRLIASSIGVAIPAEVNHYGYLSEHHSFGEDQKTAGDYAEDLAVSMLASTLGVEFDPDKAWDEREQVFKTSGKIIETENFTQTAIGVKGKWTTAIAAAVFCCYEEENSTGEQDGKRN